VGNSSAYCTSCKYGTFYQSSNTSCNSGCTSTQYKNTWNNSCNSCDAGCATCNGPTSYSCISCGGSFYLLANSSGGYCLASCPTIGYIQVGTNCKTCDPTCNTCNGVSANQCADCAANYYLYSGYCRYVCPAGTYPNSTSSQCLTCDASCSYCFGGSNSSCTSCAANLYLYNFTCTGSCPGGMAPNQWNVCFEPHLTATFALLFVLFILGLFVL
jgi:proprotein convertase subtilisin/kexin type 5